MSTAVASAPLGGHLLHVLLLVTWVPIFAGLVLRDKIKARRPDRPARTTPRPTSGHPRYAQMMAVGCICAALIHAAVMPDHFEESALYGGFFLAIASGQIGLAALLLSRPSRSLTMAGVVASGLVVVLWLATRVVGVPIGPDNGATEPFGPLDVLASAFEGLAVLAGTLSLRNWTGAPAWRLRMWSMGMRTATTFCLTGTIALSVLSPRS